MVIEGVKVWKEYVERHENLFEHLRAAVHWETSMRARWTASYGVPYNYSQMSYPERPFPARLNNLLGHLATTLDFEPNNCLLNYYQGAESRMGFHSDEIEDLVPGCGIAIVSLGGQRTLRFRSIENPELKHDIPLHSGSMLYMSQTVQKQWQHAIPKTKDPEPRISLTFRRFKT